MRFDLFFSLGDETKTCAIAERARPRANRQGAYVPKRVQDTGAALQFFQAFLAPRQMIDFLGGGLVHRRFDLGVLRRESLALVHSLGGHFSGVVTPHST